MLVMYFCARGINICHVFLCLGIESMLVMYLCVRGIDAGRVFVY